MKAKVFTIKDPVFYGTFLVVAGEPFEKARVRFSKFLKTDLNSDTLRIISGLEAGVFENPEKPKTLAIYFSDRKPGVGCLAHEVFHAVHNVMDRSMIPLNWGSNETYAYYLDWLIKEIARKLW